MTVHQHIKSNNQIDDIDSKLEYIVRSQNPNLDRFSPIRDGDEAYQAHLISQRNTKQKVAQL